MRPPGRSPLDRTFRVRFMTSAPTYRLTIGWALAVPGANVTVAPEIPVIRRSSNPCHDADPTEGASVGMIEISSPTAHPTGGS